MSRLPRRSPARGWRRRTRFGLRRDAELISWWAVGVEIKKKRPQRAPLIAQLTRYASCPQVERLVVLAPRGVDLPKSIGGKPVTMMSLERLWGIMLP